MKKIARNCLILLIVFMLAACEKTETTTQTADGFSNELNQNKLLESPNNTLIEGNINVEKSENEKQIDQAGAIEEIGRNSESDCTDNKADKLRETEPIIEASSTSEPTYEEMVLGEVKVGNTVMFGRYEQDNNPGNGPEPIEWRVLDSSEETATLIPVKCLMWGSAEEAETLPKEFYLSAFTDEEKEIISEFHGLLTTELLSTFAKYDNSVKDQTAYAHYFQEDCFNCMKDYTESAVAQGAAPNEFDQPGGVHQISYHVWSEKSWLIWSNTSQGVAWITEAKLWTRQSSTMMERGICPYIVIYTNNMEIEE